MDSRRRDLEGTIWVDTSARTLVNVEFQYAGINAAPGVRPGGEIWFHQMANGLLIIDRWHIRGVGVNERAGRDEFGDLPRLDGRRTFATEFGGEVVDAAWPDSSSWHARLGTLVVHATDRSGKPVTGFELRLRGTNYSAPSNAAGTATLSNVLPGPYRAVVADSLLGRLGLAMSSPVEFVAERDSVVEKRIVLRSAVETFRGYCPAMPDRDPTEAWFVVRVRTPDGMPVKDIAWEVARTGQESATIASGNFAYPDGTLDRCLHVARGSAVRVRVSREGQSDALVLRTLANEANVIAITLPASGPARP